MNTNALAKQYGRLTPEERFRLILAASGRGDQAERERLVRAGQRIALSMQDHAPFAQALTELDHWMYLELLEVAAHYFDAFSVVREAACTDEAPDFDPEAAEEGSDEVTDQPATEDADERTLADEDWDHVFAVGFMLKTKADGWKLFCERLNVPPFLIWRRFPGFHRLEHALAVVNGKGSLPGPAFVPEGMIRFLNNLRTAGSPEMTADRLLTAEKLAAELEEAYRERVKWWGG